MIDSIQDKRFRPFRVSTVSARERLILGLIRRDGALTRSDLIRITELPGAAVFRVTEDLASRGLVELGAGVVNGPGKPSTLVKIKADALATIGLSVMTDFAEAVLLDFAGEVRATRELTAPGMGCGDILDNLARFIDEEGKRTGFTRDAIIGLGLAIAGYFVGDGSRMNPAAPLNDWALKNLEAIASERTGLAVDVENVANAAAVGEKLLGAGRWADSFAYINVAHGLGAGLILKGQLYRGRHGNAGEIAAMLDMAAHLPVPNLETLREALAGKGIETSSVSDLVIRYQNDWPGVDAWVSWAAPSFSFLASLFRHTLDCDAIVFGGRLPKPLAERVASSVRWLDQTAAPRRNVGLPLPKLIAAEVPARSAAVGAATIPLHSGYF